MPRPKNSFNQGAEQKIMELGYAETALFEAEKIRALASVIRDLNKDGARHFRSVTFADTTFVVRCK